MEIQVLATFWAPITQERFLVRLHERGVVEEYEGTYEPGRWDFKLHKNDAIVLESQRVKLSSRDTFFGRQQYKICFEGREIGVLKRSYFRKEVMCGERYYPFPTLFRRNIPGLQLKFPLGTWLWRRKVKSYCMADGTEKMMLSIAITIYIWFTWNAIPAD